MNQTHYFKNNQALTSGVYHLKASLPSGGSPHLNDLNELTTSITGSLFPVAQIVSNLNKKINCYEKYGLTSYLGTCSENHLTRQTFIGASPSNFSELVGESETKLGDSTYSEMMAPSKRISTLQLSSHLLIITWAWKNKHYTTEVALKLNSYPLAKIFENDIISHLDINQQSSSNPSIDDSEHEDSGVNQMGGSKAFKLCSDYVSSDSSEGFEDWSFFDQKRPYDSLVRENILELLEDLQTYSESSERGVLGSATQVGAHPNRNPQLQTSIGINGNLLKPPTKATPIDTIPFEEHLFSSDINKTYTTRLRLKQRIKQFYGLTNKSKSSSLINGKRDSEYRTQGVWDNLLHLEERIDMQLFRLNWASSISQSRQLLKHKHISILNHKDRVETPIVQAHNLIKKTEGKALQMKVANSNVFLKEGDLLYWRNKNMIIKNSLSYVTKDSPYSEAKRSNWHKFPWWSYIKGDTETPSVPNLQSELTALSCEEGSFVSGKATESQLVKGTSNTLKHDSITNKGTSITIFALAGDHGSISLSKQEIQLLQKIELSDQAYHTSGLTGGIECVNPKTFNQLAKYFETHYKYTYAIRTAQKLTLEYLRLPQSSIYKDEWKDFMESSI